MPLASLRTANGSHQRRYIVDTSFLVDHTSDGLVALNAVKELMADRGGPHADLYEGALRADSSAFRATSSSTPTWSTTRPS